MHKKKAKTAPCAADAECLAFFWAMQSHFGRFLRQFAASKNSHFWALHKVKTPVFFLSIAVYQLFCVGRNSWCLQREAVSAVDKLKQTAAVCDLSPC